MARVRRDNDARYALRASFVDENGDVITGDTITIGSSNDPRISDTDIGNWNTAYGWGDHSTQGYYSGDIVLACTAGLDTTTDLARNLEVVQSTLNADAMMSFHVEGDFAVNFGLDGGTNKLSVGGWSMGANSYAIYHEGNPQINITGNAATATTATSADTQNIFREDGVAVGPLDFPKQSKWKFTEQGQLDSPPGTGSWRHVNTIQGWTAYSTSYPTYQVSYGRGAIGVRNSVSATTWGAWRTLIDSSNYTSYSPTLTGTGASGSWGINITGNATTATTATNVTGISRNVGNYGSISANTARGGYYGFSCNGHMVFMSNGSNHGIYDDVNNEWWMTFTENGQTAMNYNGAVKGYTYSSGWRVTGNLLATSNVYAYYSDKRLKDVKGQITEALDKVDAIETFYYTHNDTARDLGYEGEEMQVGVAAQSVQAVMPEVVHRAPVDDDGEGGSVTGEDYVTVDYPRLVPLLIEAIKELKAKVEELENGATNERSDNPQ